MEFSSFGDILLFLENLIRVTILFYLIKFAYKEGLLALIIFSVINILFNC